MRHTKLEAAGTKLGVALFSCLPKPREDRVLDWLNGEVARYEGFPLDALPEGERGNAMQCPLAQGLGQAIGAEVRVSGFVYEVRDTQTGRLIDRRWLGSTGTLFWLAFDLGRYPALDHERMTAEDLARKNAQRRAERERLTALEAAVAEATGREPRPLAELAYRP